MNQIFNRKPHKNIFRKLDLKNNNNIEMDNDTILTNIAIIDEIEQRTKKVKNTNSEVSYKNYNVDKLKNFQNNNIDIVSKTNMPKFFIGDGNDY
uniref:Erythrocyte membrane protein pfemp3 n=1 Tax=Strongyloides stercoralis TaxID=6248 RepID=A0A0K0DY54_STRER